MMTYQQMEKWYFDDSPRIKKCPVCDKEPDIFRIFCTKHSNMWDELSKKKPTLHNIRSWTYEQYKLELIRNAINIWNKD